MYLLYISPETENVTHLLAHDQKKSSVIFVGAEKWPDNLKSFLCCILWQCVMAGATLDVLISDGDLGLFMPSTFALASDSDGSAESNSTLLLAGEQDCGEGGEAEECVWWSAFNSMKRDILRKVDGHVCVRVCVRACIRRGVICAALKDNTGQEVIIIVGSVTKLTLISLCCTFKWVLETGKVQTLLRWNPVSAALSWILQYSGTKTSTGTGLSDHFLSIGPLLSMLYFT